MRFQQVIRSPANGAQQFVGLAGDLIAIGKRQSTPGQGAEHGGKGQAKFHMVAGVVIAPGEVEIEIRLKVFIFSVSEIDAVISIIEPGITSPWNAVGGFVEIS